MHYVGIYDSKKEGSGREGDTEATEAPFWFVVEKKNNTVVFQSSNMAWASLALVFATLITCDTLRRHLSALSSNLLARDLVLDTLVTVECCTVSLELGVIFEHYGVGFWLCGLYLNCLYQSLRWQGFKSPSPYMHLIDILSGHQSLAVGAARMAVVVASGVATYRFFVAPFWAWEMSHVHVGRSAATSAQACEIPWQSTPMVQAFLSELVGSFLLIIGPKLVADNPTLQNNEPMLTSGIISGMVVVAVYLAMDVSGGMFNPMLAVVLVGGCQGHSLLQHVTIYWVGATLGAILGAKIYPSIKSFVYRSPEAQKKDN